jgi:DNA modification methylase
MKTVRFAEGVKPLLVPIDSVHQHESNPNNGDLDALIESIQINGFVTAVTADARTGNIIAGNHRYQALHALGATEIPVIWVDHMDSTNAVRYMIADNRTGKLAVMDESALGALLTDLNATELGLAGSGYDEQSYQNLLLALAAEPEIPIGGGFGHVPSDVDDIPDAPPVSKPGDLWILGRHRLYCGDAADPASYAELLDGEQPDMLWTDPPYGIEYVGKTKDALRIENDDAAFERLLIGALSEAAVHLAPGAPVYVSGPPGPRIAEFQQAFMAAGLLWRQNLIWNKGTMVLGHSDYHYQHEPILYGFTPEGDGRLGRGGERWFGSNNSTSVFDFPKPGASREHPTMKPVALILAMMMNSLRPGGMVLDMFGGSGSTLIAAEFHGTTARIMELDPRYVDVICARYQRTTGEAPQTPDGIAIDFLTTKAPARG